MRSRRPPLHVARETVVLAGLLWLTFLLRVVRIDQPIVENYVGRQVPTAMVARNLDRGSPFLRPQLETGPFPNLFLVEPPVYAATVVGLRRWTGLGLEPSGRLISALAMVLAAWGLFGLARRREGLGVASLAVAAFATFPLTLRYGRAFQPDALMLGATVAALRCWDEHDAGRGRAWLVLGAALLATGLAVKVVAAYVLVPLASCLVRPPRRWKVALAVTTLAPALFWYVHVAHLLGRGIGSRASAVNGALWLRALGPFALGRPETLALIGRSLIVRAFTPLGFGLAFIGVFRPPGGDRLWRVWGGSALAALMLLTGKLHHEYYWLAPAPIAAVGVARALSGLRARSPGAAIAAGVGLLGLSLLQSLSTWRTPPEWTTLPEAARAVRALVPRDAWLVAPEALLFAADRRGGRLESSPAAARRAAGEWGGSLDGDEPLALVEFYRARGARFVADVGTDPARLALHEAIRRRYNVVVDRDGVLIAILTDRSSEIPGWHPLNPP
ncbi:MAG TPA: glycosyltransferase family 39 protein [Isosphaeraceae bacterium]|nr:glycosyltransferase family 39 protein [Isosphaeraceae bacterium]